MTTWKKIKVILNIVYWAARLVADFVYNLEELFRVIRKLRNWYKEIIEKDEKK